MDFVSWDDDIPNIWKNQPVIHVLFFCLQCASISGLKEKAITVAAQRSQVPTTSRLMASPYGSPKIVCQLSLHLHTGIFPFWVGYILHVCEFCGFMNLIHPSTVVNLLMNWDINWHH